jgi:hypothetical protein
MIKARADVLLIRGRGATGKGERCHSHWLAVNLSQSFQNLLDTVVHSIPKVLVFLVVLVIG